MRDIIVIVDRASFFQFCDVTRFGWCEKLQYQCHETTILFDGRIHRNQDGNVVFSICVVRVLFLQSPLYIKTRSANVFCKTLGSNAAAIPSPFGYQYCSDCASN